MTLAPAMTDTAHADPIHIVRAAWLAEQRRIDAARLRMITSIAKDITVGGDHTDLDPADMTRRHPNLWPTAADIVGFALILAASACALLGRAPPAETVTQPT